tara:strand:- start:168 stop:473 length:306 start_codon:yes stop_codon:yes gene_type:complete
MLKTTTIEFKLGLISPLVPANNWVKNKRARMVPQKSPNIRSCRTSRLQEYMLTATKISANFSFGKNPSPTSPETDNAGVAIRKRTAKINLLLQLLINIHFS